MSKSTLDTQIALQGRVQKRNDWASQPWRGSDKNSYWKGMKQENKLIDYAWFISELWSWNWESSIENAALLIEYEMWEFKVIIYPDEFWINPKQEYSRAYPTG